jgi:hypothetical protein
MANGVPDSMTPFLSIWTQPRATIRRIVDSDPTRNVIALAAIGPALSSLVSQWSAAMNGTANQSVLWPLFVALNVAVQAGLGILFLYISSVVFKWSGSLLGGTASRVEMRTALAWSQIPTIAIAIILLLALFAGVPIPKMLPGQLPRIDPPFYKVLVVVGIVGIWGFFINLKCFGEVHRFSAWRAFGAILIPLLIILIVVGVLAFLFALLVGGHH